MKMGFDYRLHRLLALIALAHALAWCPVTTQAKEVRKAQFHGAIALDREAGRSGYAVDRPTSRAASIEALNQCGGGRCEVVLSFKSSCGALARNSRQWATSSGATRQEAESKALRRCVSGDCEIAVWACTR